MGTEKSGTQRSAIWLLAFGGAGAIFFLLLTFAAALAGANAPVLFEKSGLVMKSILLVSAMVSGGLCAKRAKEKKLLHAAAGEWALLTMCLVSALRLRSEPGFVSFGVDLLLIAFGAFAGTMLGGSAGKRKRKRR